MWAVSSTPRSPCSRRLLNSTTPPLSRPLLAVSAQSQSPGGDALDGSSNLRALGQTILSAINYTSPKFPNPNPKRENQRPESKAGQISGSDVLRALQKAAAVKKEKNNRSRQMKDEKKGGQSTEGSDSEIENCGMDHRVRPLRIKSDWGLRLTELEKRLQEFSQISH